VSVDQASLFDQPQGPHARAGDPFTSQRAAEHLPRAGSQALRLLRAYASERGGLTDLAASLRAGLPAGWKRCSDLRRLRLIEWDGLTTRVERMGREQMVCEITPAGRLALDRVERAAS
jgi:hypothetical protein